jgi:hypothetical protein
MVHPDDVEVTCDHLKLVSGYIALEEEASKVS